MFKPKIEFTRTILNEKGLHARASAKFVSLVEKFESDCTITTQNKTVSGDSIMGLLMLAASKGTVITIKIWGSDSATLKKEICSLIDSGFGEDN